MSLTSHLSTRPRMYASLVVGVVAAFIVPASDSLVTRALTGWNVAVWLYLAAVGFMMFRADENHAKRHAVARAEGAIVTLVIVIIAAIVSLGAVVSQVLAVKHGDQTHHLLLAIATVIGSWILVPMLFATTYASLYFQTGGAHHESLHFPEEAQENQDFEPDYADFLYFSFTMAVASQTSDVSVTTRAMRKLVLMQALVSFVFNTTVLAFTINAASTFWQ